jgi:hypothetical protein
MSEELQHPEVEYEHSDLSALGILGFLAGLAIVGLVMHVILLGMFNYLDNYSKRHELATNPLAPVTTLDLRNPGPPVANEFPLPRLETKELGELNDQRLQEENILNSYGWVDQKAGVARIPIQRAMQLLAQRGLPVAPENMPQKTQAPVKKNSGLAPPRESQKR